MVLGSDWLWTPVGGGLRLFVGSGWWWARLGGRPNSSRSSFGSFQARLSRFQAPSIVVDRDYVPRSLGSKHQAPSIVVKRVGRVTRTENGQFSSSRQHHPFTMLHMRDVGLVFDEPHTGECSTTHGQMLHHTRANAPPHTGEYSTTHGRMNSQRLSWAVFDPNPLTKKRPHHHPPLRPS